MQRELIQSSDPENNVTTHQYDQLGRKRQTTHPDAGTSSFVYDNANNLISMQTQNLINDTKQIDYVYSYNKLMEIHYPNYPQNDVYYEYGDHNAGNSAGRIIKQQDASGVQTFKYGKLGELIENIHTFVVPGGETYTFAMNWTYDSWNRLQKMTYPDGEVVDYGYNLGGQLYSVTGTKTTRSYNYLNSVTYDKYGNRHKVENGNGTSLKYTYNQTTLRLSNLKSYNGFGEMMQDIDYKYDSVSNITQIKNNAPAMTNGLGGSSEYNYQYDDIYRLENANGIWDKKPFSLAMHYSASGNILNKTQYAQTSINGSAVTIDYNRDYSYNGSQPHAISDIDNQNLRFEWDANGNMTRYYNDLDKLKRNQCWDEENRLIAVYDDNKQLSNYLYDAAGERVWKLGGQVQQMLINNEQTVDFVNMNENKTLYANPYMVLNDKEYTKHYYTEGQRIASKIGAGLSPSIVPYIEKIAPITSDSYGVISDRLYKLCQLSDGCVGFNGEYTNYGKTIKCVKPLVEMDEPEKDVYYYHSDHIGSSSFITDRNGYASQHLQYLPFGELFVEQRSTANYYTPYKFSGKEKDEETSYSYFGARYYMSDVSVWLSVDPMMDKYPNISPFNYCHWNPVMLTDPDGMDDGWVEDPNDKSKGVYWDPKVNSDAEAQTAGVKYHGQEGYGANEETGGRIHYKPDGTSSESAITLTGPTVYGFRGDGAVCRAMEKSMNQGYDPNWINEFNYMVETCLKVVEMEINICMLELMVAESMNTSTIGMFGKAASNGGKEIFEIADGVRRVKAAEMCGQSSVKAMNNAGKVFEVPIKNLRSPFKSSIDVSTPMNQARFSRILNGIRNGDQLPPIYVNSGNRGISVFKITFKY